MISRMLRTQAAPASHKLARLALAALALLSAAGRTSAQGPQQCDALKGQEPRVKQAGEALKRAAEEAGKNFLVANEAVVATQQAAVALNQLLGSTVSPTNFAQNETLCRTILPEGKNQPICVLWHFQNRHRNAVEKVEALQRLGPPTQVKKAADEVLSALRAVGSSLPDCAEELEKLEKAPPPSGGGMTGARMPVGTLSTTANLGGAPPDTFDADVLGFHVKLENGSVTRSGDTQLAGTVSVWPKNTPSLKMVVNGNVYVKGGSSPKAIYGDGKIDLTSGGSSLAFTEGDFNTAPGGGSLTGVGKFQRYGHTFDASFTLSSQGSFSGQGEWQGRGKGWRNVPGVEVEYQVGDPLLKVSFSGATASATLDTDKVEVRTKARNTSGEHLAKAELNPDPVTVSTDGRLQLPMPTLPPPPDPNRVAREACEATARELKQDAGPCRGKFPPPPGLPNLPRRVEVQVNVIIE
jgi:hypothetical protein